MAEPDFEQIVAQLSEDLGFERLNEWDPSNLGIIEEAIGKELRKVWNARGAADVTAVRLVLNEMYGTNYPAGRMEQAIQGLDR